MNERIKFFNKYNFRSGQFHEAGYIQNSYLEKIRLFSNNFLVKVLVG